MKRAALFAAAFLWAAQAGAEAQFGVEVYPGAKPDAAVTKFLKEKMNVKNPAAYRTPDGISKVMDFYRKQPNLKERPGTRPEGASFAGNGVVVAVQNPWMDMDSGKLMKDTLVSIIKN